VLKLTELQEFAEVDLLFLAVLQVGVKRGAHQGEPAHLGRLQVQAVLVLESTDPLEAQLQQRLCVGRDEGLTRGKNGRLSIY